MLNNHLTDENETLPNRYMDLLLILTITWTEHVINKELLMGNEIEKYLHTI